MLSPVENGVKVSQDKPGDVQRREFRKLMPKQTLVTKTRGIINSRNKDGVRGIIGNDDMKGTLRHNNRNLQT